MNYPDLKAYPIGQKPDQKIIKVVGWINKTDPFPKGSVPKPILDKLWEFCKQPMGHGLKKDACQLCTLGSDSLVEYNGEQQAFDSWRLLLVANDTTLYLSPHVIFHYIVKHHYLPPQEFLDVALEMPSPASDPQAYSDTLEQYFMYLEDIEKLYIEIASNL